MERTNNFVCTACDVCGDGGTIQKLSSQLMYTRELDDSTVIDDLHWCICDDCLPMVDNQNE